MGWTAGEAGWVGPSGEEMARGLAGLLGSLLPLSYFPKQKSIREKENAEGLGKKYAHRVNFLDS